MKVKEIDLKIFSKTSFHNGSGYFKRYGLTKEESEVQTSQKFWIKIPTIGFIAKGNEIQNFYIWNGKSYDTFPGCSFSKITTKVYNNFKKAMIK